MSRARKGFEREKPALARRASWRLRRGGTFFGDGIPFAASVALALPAAVSRAAILADEARFATGHGSDIPCYLACLRDTVQCAAKPFRTHSRHVAIWLRINRLCQPDGNAVRDR